LQLPETGFANLEQNPVEQIFWGRLPIKQACSMFYYTKDSMVQQLVFEFKYRGNKELAVYMGKLMGQQLANSPHYQTVDYLVPLPLYPSKERKRGYNQAALICEGIASVYNRPVLNDVVIRSVATESQTKKNRLERWENMKGNFMVKNKTLITGKHLLLVDDVITTGATLEACARALMEVENAQISVGTLCFSSH
jgi:ComF family protein